MDYYEMILIVMTIRVITSFKSIVSCCLMVKLRVIHVMVLSQTTKPPQDEPHAIIESKYPKTLSSTLVIQPWYNFKMIGHSKTSLGKKSSLNSHTWDDLLMNLLIDADKINMIKSSPHELIYNKFHREKHATHWG